MEVAAVGGHIIIREDQVNGVPSKMLLIQVQDNSALAGFDLPAMHHIFHAVNQSSVIVSLLHEPLRKYFDSFLDTFVSEVQTTDTSARLLDLLREAFENFKRLVQLEPTLSHEQCKGLFGEFLYIIHCLDQNNDPLQTIEAWCGPDNTAHDFVFAAHSCEVKSIARKTTQITITSENQLQALPDRPLHLMVNRIETIRNTSTDSLAELYTTIITRLNNDLAKHLFREKCENIGSGYYGPDAATYPYRFHWVDTAFYLVDQDWFPGLRTGNLPAGVSHVSFRLDLSLLTEFKIDSIEI